MTSLIRIATREDFEVVNELVEALMKESVYSKLFKDYKLTHEMFSSYVTDFSQKILLLTVDDNNAVIGLSAFDILPWLYCDAPIRIARLSYIYIKPEERGKGYGKEIMSAFEHWGKAVGASYYSTAYKSDGYKKFETIYMKEIN